ncbi:hypothetical protein, partial [Escherichia coli]|uniref:hypothetical protein n=1 Tax=Escherichia coli TaxID=562 RepID=UPI001F1515D6
YCLKTQPATGETYPKSDLFNKAQYQESTKRSEITKPSCGGFFRRLIERDSDARYSQALQFSM